MPGAYLDHAASTPMRPEARAAFVDALDRLPGNPSGQHRWARDARRALDDARDQVADFVGCRPGEVVFTSGGTEADNLAVTGVVAATGKRPACLATDHHAVVAPVLAAGGALVGVRPDGVIDLPSLQALLDGSTDGSPIAVVSVALANNEVGTIQPVEDVAACVRDGRSGPALIHVDAVAAAAWLDLRTATASADLVTISGHKVGGPKGIGALIVRGDTELEPILLGGGQERERRAGTQDVAAAVAFGAALEATALDRADLVARTTTLGKRLVEGLRAIPDITFTAPNDRADATVANIVHVGIAGVEREELLFALDQEGLAVSAGSSCASGALEPSHVLAAMGIAPELAAGALRFSLGWNSTEADLDHALAVVPRVVSHLRAAPQARADAMRAAIDGERVS